jgi:hypothetical protein
MPAVRTHAEMVAEMLANPVVKARGGKFDTIDL